MNANRPDLTCEDVANARLEPAESDPQHAGARDTTTVPPSAAPPGRAAPARRPPTATALPAIRSLPCCHRVVQLRASAGPERRGRARPAPRTRRSAPIGRVGPAIAAGGFWHCHIALHRTPPRAAATHARPSSPRHLPRGMGDRSGHRLGAGRGFCRSHGADTQPERPAMDCAARLVSARPQPAYACLRDPGPGPGDLRLRLPAAD